jgi:multidrug resistance efflux pump
VLFVPIWPDFVQGRFVLEPVRRAVVRAQVSGTVAQVRVTEGQTLQQGALLVKLENLQLESEAAKADADLRVASARSTEASLHYAGFGIAERERQQAEAQSRRLSEELAKLQIASPIAGVMMTPRLEDLVGQYVAAGTKLAEVADTSDLLARVYIPEFAMRDVHVGAQVRLQPQSELLPTSATLVSLTPVSTLLDPALEDNGQKFTGLTAPQFYVGLARVTNDGQLREGMTGEAKIFVRRRSLTDFGWRFMRDQIQRRFW